MIKWISIRPLDNFSRKDLSLFKHLVQLKPFILKWASVAGIFDMDNGMVCSENFAAENSRQNVFRQFQTRDELKQVYESRSRNCDVSRSRN